MIKKMLAVSTSIVAALAVVGVAWASGNDDTSTSVTAATETSASVSADVSTPSTEVTIPTSSPSTSVSTSSSTSADVSTSTSLDDDASSTSTSIAGNTSTSAAGSAATSTSIGSSTSTSVDDSDRRAVPEGITAHTVPGVGTVTIEVFAGQLFLVNVSAPGWSVEYEKLESDRIELEFTSALDAEAEFEARIDNGRVEVRIDVD